MTLPVWMLLGFATWTVLLLLVTVGIYRWSRILRGASRLVSSELIRSREKIGTSVRCGHMRTVSRIFQFLVRSSLPCTLATLQALP